MPLSFDTVRQGETIVLPGRRGKPDLWVVARKSPAAGPGSVGGGIGASRRLELESVLRKGMTRLMTANQFDAAGFEAQSGGIPESGAFKGRSATARKLVADAQALRSEL